MQLDRVEFNTSITNQICTFLVIEGECYSDDKQNDNSALHVAWLFASNELNSAQENVHETPGKVIPTILMLKQLFTNNDEVTIGSNGLAIYII